MLKTVVMAYHFIGPDGPDSIVKASLKILCIGIGVKKVVLLMSAAHY